MGRQIQFYIIQKDFNELVKVIKKNNGIIIYSDGYELSDVLLENIFDSRLNAFKNKYNCLNIKLDQSRLVFEDEEDIYTRYILETKSDIIELSLSEVQLDNINIYDVGRLYYNKSYYNEKGELIYKLKDLNTFYNRVKRYITKNYIISEDKGYYIGPHCYELYLEGKYIPCNGRYRPVFRKKD